MTNVFRKLIARKRNLIILAVVIAAGFGYWLFLGRGNNGFETATVERRTMVQEVAVSGSVKPAEELDLAFERGGTVMSVGAKVGDTVLQGAALVRLDNTELYAQLRQVEANAKAIEAQLAELKKGARPEEIQIKETELKKANQDLANLYASTANILHDAYAKADDAVRKQTDEMFTNDEDISPQLTFVTSNSQAKTDAEFYRYQATRALNSWKADLRALDGSATPAVADQALVHGENYLATIRTFLEKTKDAVGGAVSITQATMNTYTTNLSAGRVNVNAALTSVTNQAQSISSQKLAVEKIQDELALKRAGATQEQIKSKEAQLEEALARAQSINIQLGKTVLHAPIRGIITTQDAKVGQVIAPNVVLVSIISGAAFEISANIPEIDIAKVKIGAPVRIAIEAISKERKFDASVAEIDPREIIRDNDIYYKITVAFLEPVENVRAGMTTDLEIEFARIPDALVIPRRALVRSPDGTKVKVKTISGEEERKVTIGIEDEGNAQILEGLTEGEKVIIARKSER